MTGGDTPMRTVAVLILVALGLAACGIRDAVPDDANHPLLWFVGLSAGVCLLSIAGWFFGGMLRRHERRAERREDRRD